MNQLKLIERARATVALITSYSKDSAWAKESPQMYEIFQENAKLLNESLEEHAWVWEYEGASSIEDIELADTFTFTHASDPDFSYHAKRQGDNYHISWILDGEAGSHMYGAGAVSLFIFKKFWIVQEDHIFNE